MKHLSEAFLVSLLLGCGRSETHSVQTEPKTVETAFKPVVQPKPEVSKPEVPFQTTPSKETDCSGLVSEPDLGTFGKRRLYLNGRYAVGDFAGNTFIPVLYFQSLKDAQKCAPQEMRVMKWIGGSWVKP